MTPPPPQAFSLPWWDQMAPLIQAAMVIITGVVAVCGVTTWRKQMVGKRKAELAEEVLTSFYAAMDAFTWVRSGGAIFNGEGESRKPERAESEAVHLRRNLYFVPIERLTREKEIFAKLRAQRYIFKAYFGEKGTKPFDTLASVHTGIMSSASVLIQSTLPNGEGGVVTGNIDALLDELGWGKRPRPDPVDRSIDEALQTIESLCKPILEGKRA